MKRKSVLLITTKAITLVFGIFAIVASFIAKHNGYFHCVLLGSILFVATSFELLESILNKKKDTFVWLDIILESITLVLAICYLFTEIWELKLKVLVICWGVCEILDASLELTHLFVLHRIRKKRRDKAFVVSLVCTVIKLIFGIILIIKIEHGLFVHLIVLGSLLIVSSVFQILRCLKEPNLK